jgi:hypothetical protein
MNFFPFEVETLTTLFLKVKNEKNTILQVQKNKHHMIT